MTPTPAERERTGLLDAVVGASLRHRLLTVGAAAIALAGGGWVAATLPVDVFPDLTAPTVTVLTDAHGLAPEEVESLVTFPLETAVNGAPGVRRVRSSSAQGISIVWVDFDWGTDLFRARQIVNERLQLAVAQLPDDVTAPVLAPVSSIMGEILLVGMTAPEGQLMEARTAADWTVRRRLLAVPGVSQVVPIGGEVRQYQILVDPGRMRAYGIALDEILAAAEASNRNVSGGVYRSGGREVLIRGLGRARGLEEIGLTVVAVRDGVPVLIEDVADVRIGPKIRFGTAAVNAEPAVILSIQKQPGANTLELTERVDAELDAIEAELPAGVSFARAIFRQADFISLAVENVVEALRDGAVLVVVILFLFLWNLRTTVISVLAIPLSLALAVIALLLLGGTINTMTLGGMAIAIGALVDDAIIFVENAYRRLRGNRQQPEDRRQPTLPLIRYAAREMRDPIVNATIIITVVFVPLFFLSGVEGRMLRPLGQAYIVAILASLLVAVTVTPVLCSLLLSGDRSLARKQEPWLLRGVQRVYGNLLEWTLRRSGVVVAGAGVLLLGTLAVIPSLGGEFLPPFREGSLTISVVSLPGTALAESDAIGARVERRLLAHQAVVSTSRRTGRADLDEHAQGPNASEIDARLDLDDYDLDDVLAELRADLTGFPGTSITVGQPIGHRIDHMLSGTRAAIAVNLFGPELQPLRDIAGEIEAVAGQVPGLVDIAVERQADVPQLQVRADRRAMARYGVTPGSLTAAVDVAFQGEEVSLIREGQRAFDLVVRYAEEHRADADAIGSTLVSTPAGATVPLSQLASVVPARGPNTISRENVQRKIAISANVADRDVVSAVTELQEKVAAEVALPQGYSLQYGGQFESGQAATRSITILSFFSIAAIFLVLLRAFGNIRTAVLLMANLPLALAGGVAAVMLIGGAINVATLVGFITLFGIAVRNGILLVSRYQHLCGHGLPLPNAIRRGSAERLSPIVMTALTTGLALIPLALGIGEPGKEIQAPLAVVVLGGLTTSTFLNMFVIPALFLRYGRFGKEAR
ncbi:MAG: efflux RND transporter permease subunit [Gammaproteobacteria bacterium]|nr:efflux RND transporter permease subunit [Gammaproteobacteria bacterium]MDE0259825.1 efflux RND transporter permease subunit [Gammaproteobacteria bacterium]